MKLESLKHQLPCQSVIAQFIQLRQAGENLQGLCQFHEDKDTWSLTIYPKTNSWYCFGCDRGGDIFNFLQAKGMTFPQAVEWCQQHLGKLPEFKAVPQFKKKSKKKYYPTDRVINYWHQLLKGRREYFKGRLLNDETIDRHKLGWTGNRYSIPFWRQNRILCVQSRRADGKGPKYRWELGTQPHLFGLRSLSSNGSYFVFFSTLDALLAQQDGLNAIAIPGQTVGSTGECWQELQSIAVDLLGFRDVIVIPDRGEEVKGYQLASALNCELFEWPEGDFSDYCEFRVSNPAKLFRKLIGG